MKIDQLADTVQFGVLSSHIDRDRIVVTGGHDIAKALSERDGQNTAAGADIQRIGRRVICTDCFDGL